MGGRAADFALPDRLSRSKHKGRKTLAQRFPLLHTRSPAAGYCLLAPFSSLQGCPVQMGGEEEEDCGSTQMSPQWERSILSEIVHMAQENFAAILVVPIKCSGGSVLTCRQTARNGWMDGCMDEWTGGWMDRQTDVNGNGPPDGFIWDGGRDG